MTQEESLERKLERLNTIIGEPNDPNPLDPLSGVGGPIKWVSTTGDPGRLCELIHRNSSGTTAGMPSKETLRRLGGFWAHVAARKLDSGLVVAEVHEEEPHQLIVYLGNIVECRGKKSDDSYDFGYPYKLEQLQAHGFYLGLSTGKLLAGSSAELPATFTGGEKDIKLSGAKLTVSYSIAEPILLKGSLPSKLPAVLSSLRVACQFSGTEFSLAFNLATEGYSCLLTSGAASFHFTQNGDLDNVYTVNKDEVVNAVQGQYWGLVFGACFPSVPSLPRSVDAVASMTKAIRLAVGPAAQEGKVSLDTFLVHNS